MKLLATDLDRTLFPNGKQPDDGSMEKLKTLLRTHPSLELVFVTGRHLRLIEEGMITFNAPSPQHIIAEVGTSMFHAINPDEKNEDKERRRWKRDSDWDKYIKEQTPGWNIGLFLSHAKSYPVVPQDEEKQNPFKLSFYVDGKLTEEKERSIEKFKKEIEESCPQATVVYSVDETKGEGLVDVLPACATKVGALEFLREKKRLQKEEVIYCGDSGNDLLPLTAGYKAILVRNAIPSVQTQVRKEMQKKNTESNLYIATGKSKGNGYYASGILEGLSYFGIGTQHTKNKDTH